MSEYEWVLRCQREFARVTNDWDFNWQDCAEVEYVEMFDEFPDDPEGAAHEEMSCWD